MAKIPVTISQLAEYGLDYVSLISSSASRSRPIKTELMDGSLVSIPSLIFKNEVESITINLVTSLDSQFDPNLPSEDKTDEQIQAEYRITRDRAIFDKIQEIDTKIKTNEYTKRVVIQTGFISFEAKRYKETGLSEEYDKYEAPLLQIPVAAINFKYTSYGVDVVIELPDSYIEVLGGPLKNYLPQQYYDNIFKFMANSEAEGNTSLPIRDEFIEDLWSVIRVQLDRVDARYVSKSPSFDKTKALPILEYSSGGYISNGAGQFGLAATGEGYPGGMLTPASDLSQRYVYAKYDLSGYSLGDLASLMIVQVNDVSGTKGSYMVSYAPIKMQLEYDDSDPSCAAKNQPPVTEHDDWSTPQETSITLDVMANDSDPNGDAIQITDWYFDSGDMDGSLSLVGNELVYTPSVGYTGDTVIIYVISDGEYKTKGTAKVNVYPYNILDGDNDGSLTSVEDGAPNNGDNNYDGILDSKQKDVTSVINPLTGQYQTLVISGSSCGDHQIMNYSVVAESANAVLDANRDYLLGLNKFELDCGDAGQDAILDIIYDKSYDTSKWDWIKFNTNTNIYSDASSGLGVNYRVDASGRTVAQITVRDGGSYDMDGSSNGHISDPSGPTEIISSPAVTQLANSGDNFIESFPVASFVMVASASIMVINFTKRIKNQNKYSIK